jgi:hypothetical protein
MRFQVVLSNLKTYILKFPTTFYGPSIGYHNFKIVGGMNIAIDFLGNAAVNKIMGDSTVNKDDDFPMLNIAMILRFYVEENPVRECNEIMGSTLGGLAGSVVEFGRGSSSIGGTTSSSSKKSYEMAIKRFCSLHLFLEKKNHHNYSKAP